MDKERLSKADVDLLLQLESQSRDALADIPQDVWATRVTEWQERVARAKLVAEQGRDPHAAVAAEAQAVALWAQLADLQRTRIGKLAEVAAKANGHPPAALWSHEKAFYERLRTDIEAFLRTEAIPPAPTASGPVAAPPEVTAKPDTPAAPVVLGRSPEPARLPSTPDVRAPGDQTAEAREKPRRADGDPKTTRIVMFKEDVRRVAWFDGDYGPYPKNEVATVPSGLAELLVRQGKGQVVPEPGNAQRRVP